MNLSVLIASLGLTAAISWGLSDFFAAKSARYIGPVLGMALVYDSNTALVILIYPFLHQNTPSSSLGLIFAAFAGVFISLAATCLFIGLETGPVSIVSPISSTYPLVTTLIALLAFHAHIGWVEAGGILLVVVGVMLASGLLASVRSRQKLARGPGFGFLAALLFGVGFALLAQANKHAPWPMVWLASDVAVALTLLVLVPVFKGKEAFTARTIGSGLRNPFIIGASLTSLVGFLAFNFGISESTANGGSVITAISACYPVLTMVLAIWHFSERTKRMPLVGALLGIVGIIVLSL